MDLGLTGKVAIVTGAASEYGIGNAVAQALSAEGARVVLTDIVSEGIENNAGAIRSQQRDAFARPADQSKLDEVAAVVQDTVKLQGGVDILVHCAALTNNAGSILKMDPADWRREIDISLNGSYYWLRECLKPMLAAGEGRIVTISSITSLFGGIGVPGYVTAKGGLNTLTRQVAKDYAARGITANVVVPGMVNSDLYKRNKYDPSAIEAMLSSIPMGRMAELEEVASLTTYLCSRQAAFITGSMVTVDGGTSLSI